MIKAIIFDMDGLMIDSERVTFECYQERLKDMNLTMDEEFYKTLLGKPIKGIYQRFYDVYGNDFPIENVIQDVHQLMAERFETEGVPVKKGLVELLHYLKDNNYKTIVATSSNRDRVDKILAQAKITEFFDDSICGDEVTKGKPNPEVFLKSCQKLGVNVDEAIVLEDSEAGIQASYDANIKVICIPDMKYPEKQYEEKTFKILKYLTEVTVYLKSL
jgi:HAD superfamily hydrolase (TIGR01509 family)